MIALKLIQKSSEKEKNSITLKLVNEKFLNQNENKLYKEKFKKKNKFLKDKIDLFEIEENEYCLLIENETLEDLRFYGVKISSFIKKYNNISNLIIENETNSKLIEILKGFFDKNYSFEKYITEEKKLEKKSNLQTIQILDKKITKEDIIKLENETKAINLTRNLVNEPGNVIYSETFVEEVKKVFKGFKNISIKILKKKELEKLGMHMMLGVNQGSAKEAIALVIEYKGNKKQKEYDIALIGKGVTFDSGGLSLKPANAMEDMKGDMAGAATVVGTLYNIVQNELEKNIICACGLVENMTGSNAQRPGDIVKSMSGLTVEVLNTDAEGRLVLGDILYYIKKEYNPKYMIDLATLTGAITVALGLERAGIFSKNEKLIKQIMQSGEETLNKCWHMPMDNHHSEAMKSKIADLRNTSTIKGGGSSTAAAFLEYFTDKHENWMHIDIANVSDYSTDHKLYGIGASGFGIRLLTNFIEKNIQN